MKKVSLLILFIGSLPCFLSGQRNNFTSYSINEGLPQSNVYCLLQDSRSYIWVGTDGGGACRFNGKEFEVLNKSNGLSGNVVRGIFEGSKKRIWFGTEEWITIFNGLTYQVINEDDSLKGSTILSIIEDKSHNFWACSDDHGINKIVLHENDVTISSYDNSNFLHSPAVFDAIIDKNNRLWLATLYGGIDVLTFSNDSFTVKQLVGGIDIPSSMILTLETDKKGDIWCGTYDAGTFKIEIPVNSQEYKVLTFDELNSGSTWDVLSCDNDEIWFGFGENGVKRLIPDHKNSYIVDHYTTEEGLPINQILCLIEDSEGNIWMGTNGAGLCKFGGDLFSHYGLKEGLLNDNVMGIDIDKKGSYWIATDGGGLSKLDFIDGQPDVTTFTEDNGLASNYLSCIAVGNENNQNLWIGTSKNGILKYNGKDFKQFTELDGLKDNRVYSLYVDHRGIVWIGTAGGISLYDGVHFMGTSMEKLKVSDDGIKDIIEDTKGNIWFATAGALAKYGGDTSITTYDKVEGLTVPDVNCIAPDHDNIWIGTNGGGLFFFDTHSSDSIPIRHVLGNEKLSTKTLYSLAVLNDSVLIAGSTNGMYKIIVDPQHNIKNVRNYNSSDGFIGIECNENAMLKDPFGHVWVGTMSGLTDYNPLKEKNLKAPPVIHITKVNLFYKETDWSGLTDSIRPWDNLPLNLELPFSKNHLTFYFSALSFKNPDKINYSYILDGLDDEWSPLAKDNKVTFSGLSFGNYTFKVKAQNADGIWTKEPATYQFTILPPWYRTYWFYIICVLFVVISFYIYIKIRERKLKIEKAILEQKVKERTAEVVKQKEEIEEKNKEITDSINYASRIQSAILPLDEQRQKFLPNSFILFKPKDIVSGDFYWISEKSGSILFTAADCTGHGVPGAFMSMIGSALLNEVVNKNGVTRPGEVLNEVRNGIILSLKQTGEEGKQKDGMDMSLCSWRKEKNILEYAGANNSLFLIRKTGTPLTTIQQDKIDPNIENNDYSLFEIKASKQPVGYYTGSNMPFENNILNVLEGDTVYSFSDGYPDQFGGPNGKKFKYKSFKKLILSFQDEPLNKQKEILDNTIEEWKGDEEQVDDICIIGVRL